MDNLLYSVFLEITDKLRADQVNRLRAAKTSVQIAELPVIEPAVVELPPEDPIQPARTRFGQWLRDIRVNHRQRRAERYAAKQQRRLDRYHLRAARRAERLAIENAARIADVGARIAALDDAIRIVSDVFAPFFAAEPEPETKRKEDAKPTEPRVTVIG